MSQLRHGERETPAREVPLHSLRSMPTAPCLSRLRAAAWVSAEAWSSLAFAATQSLLPAPDRRVCGALWPETCLGAGTSPLTFLVGIFSFRNSASLHSTFQGAWIFTNPTPWILVWKRRGILGQCGQTRGILTSGPSLSELPHWPLPPLTPRAPLHRAPSPLLAGGTGSSGGQASGSGEPGGLGRRVQAPATRG